MFSRSSGAAEINESRCIPLIPAAFASIHGRKGDRGFH